MVALRKAGKLNLGIERDVAARISMSPLNPKKSTAPLAFTFWNAAGFLVFLVSIYWSFTDRWWWFIPGIVAMIAILRANHTSNGQNLIDAAMADAIFYENVRKVGGWLYQMDADAAAQHRSTQS
jgi:hypothetical protein